MLRADSDPEHALLEAALAHNRDGKLAVALLTGCCIAPGVIIRTHMFETALRRPHGQLSSSKLDPFQPVDVNPTTVSLT